MRTRRHHVDFMLADAPGAINLRLQEANVKPFQIDTGRGGRSLALFERRRTRVTPFAKYLATLDWRRIAFLMFVFRASELRTPKKGGST